MGAVLMSFGYGTGPSPSGPSGMPQPQSTWGTIRQGVLDYAQDVLSGKIAREGVLAQPRPYDLNKSLRENLPEISQNAIDVAMGVGPGAIRAFHGSPHSFSRFDSSKIGTGEGAQAYGHGLYFAEAEPVAESYLRNATWKYGGRNAETIYDRLNSQAMERGLDNAGWDNLNAQRGFWEKVALGRSPRSIIDDAMANPGEYGSAELSYIQSLDPSKFRRTGGHMYEVDINADPQRLLDWDKPLSQQPEVASRVAPMFEAGKADVIARRRALDETLRAQGRVSPFGPDNPVDAFDPLRGQNLTGGSLYDRLGSLISPTGLSRLNAPPRVSQQLNEAGIPGIRYLDQGSRSGGQGTSNYVIFNDKLIDILRKYGIVPPVVGGGLLAGAGSEPPT